MVLSRYFRQKVVTIKLIGCHTLNESESYYNTSSLNTQIESSRIYGKFWMTYFQYSILKKYISTTSYFKFFCLDLPCLLKLDNDVKSHGPVEGQMF